MMMASTTNHEDLLPQGNGEGGTENAMIATAGTSTEEQSEGENPNHTAASNNEDEVALTSTYNKDENLVETAVVAETAGSVSATTPVVEEEEEIFEPTFFADEKGNLKFVNLVVRYPCGIFWSILVIAVFLSFLLGVIVFQGGNPFTDPVNQFDMDDVRSIQYDSLRLARDEVTDVREAREQDDESTRVQSKFQDITYWVFESETDEGLFGSAESIKAMKEAFDLFTVDSGYEKYCLLNYNAVDEDSTGTAKAECEIPLSSLRMYYPSEWDTDMVATVIDELKDPSNVELFNSLALCFISGQYCDLIPTNITQEQITWATEMGANLTTITSSWDMKGELVEDFAQVTELASYLMEVGVFKGFVDFGFDKGFSIDNPVSKYSRGILIWGGPLPNKDNKTLDDEDQFEEDSEKLKDYILDNHFDDMEDLADTGYSKVLNSYYFMGALIFDVLLRIVARDGMLAIISLVFVFIWIRINTGSLFLAGVGILEVFLSIPVAWFFYGVVFQIKYFAFLNALSIFIVAAIGADDIFIFMDAYKQSKHRLPGNLVSLEKRMSWVYRRTGTAMAITSATTCAAFLCTLITPLSEIQSFGIFAACVIAVDYVLVMTLFCTSVVIYHDRYEDRRAWCGCCTDCMPTDPSPTKAARDILLSGEDGPEAGDRVSLFFRNKVSPFIQVPWHRAVMLLMFVGWISIAAWQATKLEPIKETEQFLDEDHPIQRAFDILGKEFPTADDDLGLKVYYAWGLDLVDRAGVNMLFDPENYGTPTFDDSFDFNEQCQTELVKMCDKLRTDSQYVPYIKRAGGVGSVYCFLDELAVYNLRGDLSDCEYVRQGLWKNETWQVPPSELASIMPSFIQQQSCYDDTETIIGRYGSEIGWDGESMRYAGIAVESQNLDPFQQRPENFVRRQYDEFISIGQEFDGVVSEYCSGEVIVTDLDGIFVFMNNQAIYVRTAIQSSLLGVTIAFFVLLLATRVFHLAVFASLSIISTLVSVTGTMVMLGWSLGAIESILIGIIAGFSVDYVVHLAHAYEVAEGDTYERMTEAFGDMGISVMNGMITSVAASIPLFFCQLQFFRKFGTFLCLTIAFSWLFANFAFMSVLATFKIKIKTKACLAC